MSLERQRQLQHLHNMLVQLVMHEGRFISERTNNFLLYNSIFFAGFLILKSQLPQTSWSIAVGAMISFAGIVFSIFHFLVIGQNVRAANFWRSTIGLIEKDSDFWQPEKKVEDKDLDFFSAKSRSEAGEEVRQEQYPLKRGGISIKNFPCFAPNLIFGFYLPFIIGLLWLLAFIWTMTTIN